MERETPLAQEQKQSLERLYMAISEYKSYKLYHKVHPEFGDNTQLFQENIFGRYMETRHLGLTEEGTNLLVSLLGKPEERK